LRTSFGGYSVAMIATIDPVTRTARSVATGGVPVDGIPEGDFQGGPSEGADTSLTGRVIRSGEAVVCDDLLTTTLPVAGREDMLKCGIRSLACLPLRVDQTTIGAFMIGGAESSLMGPDELQLLHEVAGSLSFAIAVPREAGRGSFPEFFSIL